MMKIDELKKMSLEELKAISRPLEVGEIIQEWDWFEFGDEPDFANKCIGDKQCSLFSQWYRPSKPTDKPADEIKLGWYRLKNPTTQESRQIARLGIANPDDNTSCLGYWHESLEPDWFYLPAWEFIGTTLPEPGEWVDPGEVKLSELPIRARFTKPSGEHHEGQLTGFECGAMFKYIADACMPCDTCQVWRPSK